MRETKSQLKERTEKIIKLLKRAHPDAKCALHYSNAFELLIATILSAQCTDERVNKVTPDLFKKYKTATDLAVADPTELEREIQSTGFFRNKAKSLRGMAAGIVERHHGQVPQTMEDLTNLPGV